MHKFKKISLSILLFSFVIFAFNFGFLSSSTTGGGIQPEGVMTLGVLLLSIRGFSKIGQ